MRKSSQKTLRFELSSRLPPLAAGLVVDGAVRHHANKRSGAPKNGRHAPFAMSGRDELLRARLRLVEGFLSRTEIADCAHYALQWLGEVLGFSRSLCLIRLVGEQALFTIASYGLPGGAGLNFTVSLDDWSNPLVTILHS